MEGALKELSERKDSLRTPRVALPPPAMGSLPKPSPTPRAPNSLSVPLSRRGPSGPPLLCCPPPPPPPPNGRLLHLPCVLGWPRSLRRLQLPAPPPSAPPAARQSPLPLERQLLLVLRPALSSIDSRRDEPHESPRLSPSSASSSATSSAEDLLVTCAGAGAPRLPGGAGCAGSSAPLPGGALPTTIRLVTLPQDAYV